MNVKKQWPTYVFWILATEAVGGISALLGTMVCGLADYIWMYPRVMLIFWFVAGVALAGIKVAAQEKDSTV